MIVSENAPKSLALRKSATKHDQQVIRAGTERLHQKGDSGARQGMEEKETIEKDQRETEIDVFAEVITSGLEFGCPVELVQAAWWGTEN